MYVISTKFLCKYVQYINYSYIFDYWPTSKVQNYTQWRDLERATVTSCPPKFE